MNSGDFLAVLQEGFPLCERPFLELDAQLNATEEEAIELYSHLKEEKIIRQTSAILDTKRLGYLSSLVAFKIDEAQIDDAAAFISTHPGVSHNYKRAHSYNLWFTIAVPPDSALGLEGTVKLLAKKVGAVQSMLLPTLKMFKISVKLDTNNSKELKEKVIKKEIVPVELTPLHYRIIAQIQEDLSACEEPFAQMISHLGIDYPLFFECINDLSRGGYMRRYATILNHRNAGFVANAMVVWDIDDTVAEAIGAKAAEFSAVSHCYLRPRFEGWNYNLFTTTHASSNEELETVIERMGTELGARDHFVLTSLHEYKKIRIKYFTPDTYAWEQQFTLGAVS
ncbi:MAG: Lrp/AsnC family transcriptional regulator [Sulfuricurvum sp.]|nr:Lrp/AsnC family transcriptional regulator [Sulfuricurvum sp.]